MKFSEVIEGLNAGNMYQRYSKDEWNGKVIVKQVASAVPADIVPKMTSLPEFAKQYLSTIGAGGINYHDQVLIISVRDGLKLLLQAISHRGKIFLQMIG